MTYPEFKGKTVFISGASEGIGRATATEFAKNGANLIVVARNEARLNSLKEELSPYKVTVQCLSSDFSKSGAVAHAFSKIKNLDYAVNNAGTEGKIAEFQDLETPDYQNVFDINVRSVFECMKYEIQSLLANKKPGAIVNVSSILGFRGITGSSLYVASKHAVIGLTKSAALEQASSNIRINAVCPGATDTPMIRRVLGDSSVDFVGSGTSMKLAHPTDIANAILWLCSDQSKMVIGHSLVVDAGTTAK